MDTSSRTLIQWFPALADDSLFEVTSPETWDYNCIAWAHNQVRWEWAEIDYPEDPPYWPEGVLRENTIEAYIANFEASGFTICQSLDLEEGILKIAIFATPEGVVTHASRQLPDGAWTSKIGAMSDIRHSLLSLEGEIYGRVCAIMQKVASATSC